MTNEQSVFLLWYTISSLFLFGATCV